MKPYGGVGDFYKVGTHPVLRALVIKFKKKLATYLVISLI
jgi:hypothetical protein